MPTKTLSPFTIKLFFYIGILSATLFRLILFLNRIDLFWGRTAWYVGVFGYILFFGFRYYIARKRRNTILQNRLIEKVQSSDLQADDREEVVYLLQSLIKSKEVINYIYIFITSFLAVGLDLLLTLLG